MQLERADTSIDRELFGAQMEWLSLPLRALTLSGLLAVIMTYMVMPGLSRLFSAKASGQDFTKKGSRASGLPPRGEEHRDEG